jgi:predicted ribosomally synthesized peptide with SipW-like signal peptide
MKKTKVIIISCITILVCLSLIIVGTYALFSQTVNIENHLQAGTLKVKLERTNLIWVELNVDGYLEENQDSTVKDFTSPTSENIFGIEDGVLVVPGCYYEASMRLTNDGSVAFDYIVKIMLKSASNKLAEQIKVIVDGDDANKKALSIGENTVSSGTIDKTDASKAFTVKIVFEEDQYNNAAQNLTVDFDLVVEAIQRTAE